MPPETKEGNMNKDNQTLLSEAVLSKKNNAKQRALAVYKTVYEFC